MSQHSNHSGQDDPINSTDVVKKQVEPEWTGPFWLHPYFLYALLTVMIFGFMLMMGFLAVQLDWLPRR